MRQPSSLPSVSTILCVENQHQLQTHDVFIDSNISLPPSGIKPPAASTPISMAILLDVIGRLIHRPLPSYISHPKCPLTPQTLPLFDTPRKPHSGPLISSSPLLFVVSAASSSFTSSRSSSSSTMFANSRTVTNDAEPDPPPARLGMKVNASTETMDAADKRLAELGCLPVHFSPPPSGSLILTPARCSSASSPHGLASASLSASQVSMPPLWPPSTTPSLRAVPPLSSGAGSSAVLAPWP